MDYPIVDTGRVAPKAREIVADGVNVALELVGTATLPDTLASTPARDNVCFAGMLSNQWIVPNIYPIAYLPPGLRLAAYGGASDDLPAEIRGGIFDRIAIGGLSRGPIRGYDVEQIR